MYETRGLNPSPGYSALVCLLSLTFLYTHTQELRRDYSEIYKKEVIYLKQDTVTDPRYLRVPAAQGLTMWGRRNSHSEGGWWFEYF